MTLFIRRVNFITFHPIINNCISVRPKDTQVFVINPSPIISVSILLCRPISVASLCHNYNLTSHRTWGSFLHTVFRLLSLSVSIVCVCVCGCVGLDRILHDKQRKRFYLQFITKLKQTKQTGWAYTKNALTWSIDRFIVIDEKNSFN
jgi:hypothetical protein